MVNREREQPIRTDLMNELARMIELGYQGIDTSAIQDRLWKELKLEIENGIDNERKRI